MKRISGLLLVSVLVLTMSGCENSNIFSWTHKAGGDDSVEALLTDGQKAIIEGDYDKAIEYYTKILEKDPDNAEALYGLAAAELKSVGLDLSELLPKFLKDNEGAISAPAYKTTGRSAKSSVTLDSLLPVVNYALLEAATAIAVDALETIALGNADGTIPADDIDVTINLAVAKIIHAVAYLLNKYDITVDEDFNVTGYEAITQADKTIVLNEVESALDYIALLLPEDIDIGEIKDGIDKFKKEIISL